MPGRLDESSAPFRRVSSARLAGGVSRPGRLDRLFHHPFAHPRVFFEILGELLVDDLLDPALDLRGHQLVLRLGGELRVLDLDRHDGGETLAHVVTGEILLEALRQRVVLDVGVHPPRQGRLETREVGAAIAVVDRVGEAVDLFLIAVVPLQRDLHRLLTAAVVAGLFEPDRLRMEGVLIAVEMLDEAGDATFVAELSVAVGAVVVHPNAYPPIEKRELAQPLGEGVVLEFLLREDLAIGPEADLRADLFGLAYGGDRLLRNTAVIDLVPDAPVALDFELESLRERVDHRDANAVKATGDFVDVVVELPARVQLGHDDLGGGAPFAFMVIDGYAATVVLHRHRIVGVNRRFYYP